MLNPCCAKLNGRDTSINAPHWADLLLTVNANRTMEYLLRDPEGKGHYAAFTALLATAVAKHPAAIGIELSEYTHRHTSTVLQLLQYYWAWTDGVVALL